MENCGTPKMVVRFQGHILLKSPSKQQLIVNKNQFKTSKKYFNHFSIKSHEKLIKNSLKQTCAIKTKKMKKL